ncbi:hypothetical protein MRX96_054906 [Rhipicephalus microplus]
MQCKKSNIAKVFLSFAECAKIPRRTQCPIDSLAPLHQRVAVASGTVQETGPSRRIEDGVPVADPLPRGKKPGCFCCERSLERSHHDLQRRYAGEHHVYLSCGHDSEDTLKCTRLKSFLEEPMIKYRILMARALLKRRGVSSTDIRRHAAASWVGPSPIALKPDDREVVEASGCFGCAASNHGANLFRDDRHLPHPIATPGAASGRGSDIWSVAKALTHVVASSATTAQAPSSAIAVVHRGYTSAATVCASEVRERCEHGVLRGGRRERALVVARRRSLPCLPAWLAPHHGYYEDNLSCALKSQAASNATSAGVVSSSQSLVVSGSHHHHHHSGAGGHGGVSGGCHAALCRASRDAMEEQAGPWPGYEGRQDPAVLAQEDMDMFFHSLQDGAGPAAASSYYGNPAARAVHGYRPAHRKCLCTTLIFS